MKDVDNEAALAAVVFYYSFDFSFLAPNNLPQNFKTDMCYVFLTSKQVTACYVLIHKQWKSHVSLFSEFFFYDRLRLLKLW